MKLTNEQLEMMFAESLKDTAFDYENLAFGDENGEGNDVSVFLGAYSHAGGENSADFEGDTFKHLLDNICTYAYDFDPDDEFDLWYGAHNGEPSTPSELLEDCNNKKEQWSELEKILYLLQDEINMLEKMEEVDFLKQTGVDSYYYKSGAFTKEEN